MVLLATLPDLHSVPEAGRLAERLSRMLDPVLGARDVVDGLRNVALFAGWGLVWVLTAPVVGSGAAVRNAVLTGAGISLAVELLQLTSETRTASILDVGTNTIGALFGAVALLGAVQAMNARRGLRSFVGLPAAAFAVGYGAAVVAEALVPLFRQATPPGAYGWPLSRMAAVLRDFRWSSVTELPLADFPLFLPAGFFAVAALVESGRPYRGSATRVALAGVALAFLLEVAHGFLGLRLQLGAAVVHALAVATGSMLAVGLLPRFSRSFRGRARPQVLALLYVGLIALWILRPYVPTTDTGTIVTELGRRWWLPLGAHRIRVDVFSVVDLVTGFMVFLPAGALLAVWPVRLRGALSGFLPLVYLAVTLELAQFLLPTRTVDATDILVQSAAAAVGWTIARRAGFRVYGSMLAS